MTLGPDIESSRVPLGRVTKIGRRAAGFGMESSVHRNSGHSPGPSANSMVAQFQSFLQTRLRNHLTTQAYNDLIEYSNMGDAALQDLASSNSGDLMDVFKINRACAVSLNYWLQHFPQAPAAATPPNAIAARPAEAPPVAAAVTLPAAEQVPVVMLYLFPFAGEQTSSSCRVFASAATQSGFYGQIEPRMALLVLQSGTVEMYHRFTLLLAQFLGYVPLSADASLQLPANPYTHFVARGDPISGGPRNLELYACHVLQALFNADANPKAVEGGMALAAHPWVRHQEVGTLIHTVYHQDLPIGWNRAAVPPRAILHFPRQPAPAAPGPLIFRPDPVFADGRRAPLSPTSPNANSYLISEATVGPGRLDGTLEQLHRHASLLLAQKSAYFNPVSSSRRPESPAAYPKERPLPELPLTRLIPLLFLVLTIGDHPQESAKLIEDFNKAVQDASFGFGQYLAAGRIGLLLLPIPPVPDGETSAAPPS
ncbi:hypothetical protein PAPYR_8094 [Paratrimastix pyriformis]|uniref:Uncharacterized protein n=1 Tax=Paratrimastix pyriformis TaxID=342808 RepID=A0ABQ8UBE5_9EUKA|nr:hypothetical protein PAPYR_8094 [Paratrimastix pyriformis]